MTVDTFSSRAPRSPRELARRAGGGRVVRAFARSCRSRRSRRRAWARGRWDAEHHFYTRLVNDLAIYGIVWPARSHAPAPRTPPHEYGRSRLRLPARWSRERRLARRARGAPRRPRSARLATRSSAPRAASSGYTLDRPVRGANGFFLGHDPALLTGSLVVATPRPAASRGTRGEVVCCCRVAAEPAEPRSHQ